MSESLQSRRNSSLQLSVNLSASAERLSKRLLASSITLYLSLQNSEAT